MPQHVSATRRAARSLSRDTSLGPRYSVGADRGPLESALSPARWKSALFACLPVIGLAAASGGSGCVHVYQPLSGLHRPVVIDTGLANFEGVRLAIYCPAGDGLNPSEAASLCRKVGVLFQNQGAEVSTSIRDNRFRDDGIGEGQAAAEEAPTDLVLELRSRELHESNDPLSWLLCAGTFTLVPAVTEFSFAQDVIIRDGDGFVLLSDTLQGRIIRRFGAGAWAGNKVLDLIWRDDEDELLGDAAKRELSQDLYQQLSQLVFNATMRLDVLKRAPAASTEAAR